MQFFANKNHYPRRFNQALNKTVSNSVSKFVKDLIEKMINEEFVDYIKRKPYDRLKGEKISYRNGYRERKILFKWTGMINLRIPRCRKIRFIPKAIYGNLSDPEVETMIMQVWAEGGSYRDIRSLISRLYGTAISLKLLHRIISQVKKYVEEFHQREIKTDYDCLYVDGLYIRIKSQKLLTGNQRAVVLALLGQRREKKKIIREIIDYRIFDSEDQQNYTEFFMKLKKRGLSREKVKLLIHDGHPSITKSIHAVYGKDKVKEQACMIHKLRNVLSCIEDKYTAAELKPEIWKVYNSTSKEEFYKSHKEVFMKNLDKQPEAMKVFGKIDSSLLTRFELPHFRTKDIISNNPIERYFREIKRRIKAIGIFENKNSADKLLFLIIEYLNQRRGALPFNDDLKFTH